jgi:Striatin family
MSAMRKPIQTSTNTQLTDQAAFRRINYMPASTPPPTNHIPASINGNINGNGNGNGTGISVEDNLANYTLQGVMQWLNGEYRRYERDRNNWEIERASLVVYPFYLEVIVGSSFAFDGNKSWQSEGAG